MIRKRMRHVDTSPRYIITDYLRDLADEQRRKGQFERGFYIDKLADSIGRTLDNITDDFKMEREIQRIISKVTKDLEYDDDLRKRFYKVGIKALMEQRRRMGAVK